MKNQTLKPAFAVTTTCRLIACASSQPGAATSAAQKPAVFVAGATGNVGSRLVRLLCEAGCTVRAGSRDSGNFDAPTDTLGSVTHTAIDMLTATSDDYISAIGESSIVISAVGAPFSFGRVDGWGIASLMRTACQLDGVDLVVVVSSIGVGRPWAFPAGALNLFGGVLLFKDWSEATTRKYARQFGKPYLIVRPGGMESPTDDYELTHNMKIEQRNSLAGGQVSNLQIARLITQACLSPEVTASGKTIEVVAETDAPKLPLRDLLTNAELDW